MKRELKKDNSNCKKGTNKYYCIIIFVLLVNT